MRHSFRGSVLCGSILSMAISMGSAADKPPLQATRQVGTDRAAGTSSAVIVGGLPLVHTSQFLASKSDGDFAKLNLEGEARLVLSQLDQALRQQGASLQTTVKLNVCVTDSDVTTAVRRVLSGHFAQECQPAVSFVQSRLPLPAAKVAMDAVATASSLVETPRRQDDQNSGSTRIRHAATLPVGPRVYVSGQAEKGASLAEATRKTLESLKTTLQFLGSDLSRVVQVKSFLTPMSDVRAAEDEIVKFFGGSTPPCVFVEWQSTLPIEIELVASVSADKDGDNSKREPLEFITPPGMTASPVFCRVVRVNDPRTIFVSSLYARQPADGAGQVTDVFAQLQDILKQSGSDLRHLAKATYYVSDNDASAKLNELRPKFYAPQRPPAASKAQVFGVGLTDRSLTLDMIAVPATLKP